MRNTSLNNHAGPSFESRTPLSGFHAESRTPQGFGERLVHAREKSGITQRELAKRVGVTPSTYQRWEYGSVPTGKNLYDLAEVLGCSTDWLLGRGQEYRIEPSDPMYVRSDPEAPYTVARAVDLVAPPVPGVDPQAFDLVPMATARLSAGGGAVVMDEDARDYYAFRKEWLRRVITGRAAAVLMSVVGDSMAPTISGGDVVMIDLGRKEVYDGFIYAIGQGDLIYIKRLQGLPGTRIRIISDNERESPPYEADAREIRILGQVIWHARELVKRSD